MINIANVAFEEHFKVNEGCCLWKCTEKKFSQRPDAQVSIGNHEGRRRLVTKGVVRLVMVSPRISHVTRE